MFEDKLKRISKFLSLVLRHKPEHIGLTLDSAGWADVEELIAKSLVEQAERIRFSFSDDGKRIRANYGHSIPIRLEDEPEEPPEFLFHGTAVGSLPSIRRKGLGPGDRQYVHLVEDESAALEVGRRHGEPVVLRVEAREMFEKGHEFYKTKSSIWLTKEVPAEYIFIKSDSTHTKIIKGESEV
jgi:putative RNA 2'-phosphotransferase